LKLTAAEAEQ